MGMAASVKHRLRYALGLTAGYLVSHPRLRQRLLQILEILPDAVETGIRRLLSADAPGALAAFPEEPEFAGMSAREIGFYRALRRRLMKAPLPGHDTRPRLAYFSPLPPERSGISHYSLMLLPQLAMHYRIEIITDREPDIGDRYPVRSVAWFREHGHNFDRILYQIGNAPFHSHMFDLLEEWPGAVVLHDFFLGHVMGHIDATRPGYLAACLYREAGFGGLRSLAGSGGREQVIWDHPLNWPVLENAAGVIVHSGFSRELIRRHFGDRAPSAVHIIPHLKEPAPEPDRDAARQALGITPESFVVCSFGFITPTKRHDRILDAWLDSQLSEDPDNLLVFVGEKSGGSYGREIAEKIRAHPRGNRVRITGWADAELFGQYLSAADVAVQLRSQSRGETSGAVIDCLNHGLATIVNRHGTMADFPDDSVFFLPDQFSNSDLAGALGQLYSDAEARAALGRRARETIAQGHDPQRCGSLYREAIESIYARADKDNRHLDEALEASSIDDPDDPALVPLAATLAVRHPPVGTPKQLLVDVSAIVHTDLKTGIERVVRAQLLALINGPPAGYRVEPVYLKTVSGHWQYHYARHYGCRLFGAPAVRLPDRKIDTGPGDILYMPDLNPAATASAHEDGLFLSLRERGVQISVLVHDLLPVTMPQHFPAGAPAMHNRWLEATTAFADRLICISAAVASDLSAWSGSRGSTALPPIVVNHHGADIAPGRSGTGLARRARKILARLEQTPTFLMVGTIEPRKGHLQAIDAFDLLWQRETAVNLVIVGREGWQSLPEGERRTIPAIRRRLDLHPRNDKQLFWLNNVDDTFLDAIYAASDCLLAASEGEGFGLPLIEAAQHGVPVLARDIPVFREVAGDCASYFSGDEPEAIADAVTRWLDLSAHNQHPDIGRLPIRTWSDNVETLKEILTSAKNRGGTAILPGHDSLPGKQAR